MKNFFYSFLATMAGIWVSVLLIGVLVVLTIVALVSGGSETQILVDEGTVLRINLSGAVSDRATARSLEEVMTSQGNKPISLSDLVAAVDVAADDDDISGILLECPGDLSIGMAQCEEFINALRRFKKSGKWVWAYADNYSQADYFIATAADSLFINPVGMIDVHGLGGTMFFFKDLLDKIGVDAQVVRVGTYKSAMEPFLLSDISEANREQTMHFLNRLWDCMRDSIAKSRGVATDSVTAWANRYEFARPTFSYLSDKLVDKMIYRRQLDDMLCEATGNEELSIVDFQDYIVGRRDRLVNNDSDARVAVLYAQGDIAESGNTGITSESLVPEILRLAEDESIKGLVLRVNSGGGSAFASEQIWEALEQYKATTGNPFYVSMGDMAASGGYYISCGADKIFASPLTLTGSIGIFGMIPNVETLLKDKLGVNTVTLTTNTGSMPDIFSPMSEDQRGAMQEYVNRGYDLFLSRVAQGRGMTVEAVGKVAQGRVWSGTSALESGLVDELGGLRACLESMAKKLGVGYEDLIIEEYPEVTPQWWEPFAEMGGQQLYAMMASPLDQASDLYKKRLQQIVTMYPLQCRANYIKLK